MLPFATYAIKCTFPRQIISVISPVPPWLENELMTMIMIRKMESRRQKVTSKDVIKQYMHFKC